MGPRAAIACGPDRPNRTDRADFFGVQLPRVESPRLPLVVFVAVQTPAGNPFAVDKRAFVDGGNPDVRAVRSGLKRYAKPLAGSEKLIGPVP